MKKSGVYFMKKKSFLILNFFIFLSAALLFADENKNTKQNNSYELNIEEAVDFALKNNVEIERSRIPLQAAQRASLKSWNSLSPSISASAVSNLEQDLSLSASVNFNFSANLFSSMKNAKLLLEQNKITFEQAVKSVELSVRQAFYTLLYEKENIVLQEENLKIAKTQYESNLEKYNSGRLSEIDAMSAEVNYKSKIPSVQSAQTTYENDLDYFKQILGLHIDDEVTLSGSLEDTLFLEDITVDETKYSPYSIKLLENKIQVAKTSILDKKFTAFSPSISAKLNYSYGTILFGDELSNPQSKTTTSITASIPLDGILPWSTKIESIKTAKDTLTDLELQLDEEKKDFTRLVKSSLRSISQSQDSLRYKMANIELAEKTYSMTKEAYNRGTKDLLTLQNASTTLLNAKVSLNSEILSFNKEILSLENSLNIDFGELTKNSNILEE